MYNAFFEFEENPFSARPDPAFFYRSKQHDATLRSLTFAVQARMGLASLVGEEGTGKTILLERLRETLETAQIHCAFLRDSRISTNRFFQTIATELDLQTPGTSPYQVFSALHQFTLQQARKGRTVALIVDDAHSLPGDVLNEILHLASLHDDKLKLLQTVLAGRPELHSTLDSLNLERLKQHAILSCHLDPFTAEETERYIEFRLAKAGLSGQTIFPPDAISEIYHRSRGFAPAIHAICEGLLLAAFSAGSKVCTEEILDQVFRNARAEAPQVVAVTRIDLARLVAPSEPEPPAALTALLQLTFAAIQSTPPPLAAIALGLLEPQRVALRRMFPSRKIALTVGEFAWGSKKPMPLMDAATIAPSAREIHAIPSAVTPSRPVLSIPALRAEPIAESTLLRLRHNLTAPPLGSPSVVVATAIDFPSMALQPANSVSEASQALRCSNKLLSLACSVTPRPGVAGVPAGAQAVSIPVPPVLQPAHSAMSFRAAGTLQRTPRVPVTPFAIAQDAPPAPRASGDFQNQLVNLQNPVGPPRGSELGAPAEPNVPEHDRLVSLSCNVLPSAPAAQTPVKAFLNLLQSLQPHGPVLNLEALNPRNSWLLLPSWKPADRTPVASNPAIENAVVKNPDAAIETVLARTGTPASFNPKWLLSLALPILSLIALYGLVPALLPAASSLNQGFRRAHQVVVARAAVALREDFRAGLDDWMNRGGARPSWTSDASGFVHPGALALYRPSLGLADYQMQFVGTIDGKALSWVVRAADFNNYYAVRLTVLKPGPVPAIGATRYAVINGKTQSPVTTPLLMSARSDTVYRVSLDVHGDRFALSVQDQPVDSWTEPKLRQGGIGFFSEPDAASRITAVQVNGQDDMIGRLCALLSPSAVASYQASLTERAALNLIPEMGARMSGRGGSTSSSSGYGRRLPRGTGRLDPAFWQAPEVNVPNARRCGSGSGRAGATGTRRTSPFSGAWSSTTCY